MAAGPGEAAERECRNQQRGQHDGDREQHRVGGVEVRHKPVAEADAEVAHPVAALTHTSLALVVAQIAPADSVKRRKLSP